jgi:RimJ/RimL family protein N-acetyltransferase
VIPEIRTSRLRLRSFREGDRRAFGAFVEDPEYLRHLGPDHPDLDTFMANNLSPEEGREFSWVICRGDADEPIGSVFLGVIAGTADAEVACLIDPAAWGKGYATEATGAVISFGFDTVGLERVFGRASLANGASIRAMEKLGMQRDPAHARASEMFYSVRRGDWSR